MELKNIKTILCFESKDNPRGKDFEDKEFEELKKSIEKNGILVPVLARRILQEISTTKKGNEPGIKYEIIAGARRLRAAKQLKIEEIPAKIVEMTDEEAAEAQIIENLQRKDIHPIEEGQAYRKMVDKLGFDVKLIAKNIGKGETYIRYRLTLTNLIEPAQKAFRSGKILEGHAVLISDLSPHHQKEALKYCLDKWNQPTVKELKEWIVRQVYQPLKNQPWLISKEMTEAVGPCVECPPNKQSLFGDIKEGACTDLRCWSRKMKKYIDIKKAEWKEKGIELIEITKAYNMENKAVISRSRYEMVGKKKCGHETKAIVVEGEGMGQIQTICVDADCPVHGEEHYDFKPTAKQKEERKKEREKAKKEKEAKDKKLLKALDKVKLPLSENHVEALLSLSLDIAGSNASRSICKRHDIEVKKESNGMGYSYFNYQKALKNWISSKSKAEKIKMAFELLIDTGYDSQREGVGKL
jgi:ParB family chromosome partitioning protein